VDVLVVVWLVRRAYGIGYIEYLRAVFVPAAIPAPIAYAAIVGMKILVPADNLGVVLTEAVIGCLLYALVFMALGIGRQERASLRKAFSRE
jgi:hypothetical protein